jgi:hypothetical protein
MVERSIDMLGDRLPRLLREVGLDDSGVMSRDMIETRNAG